MPRLATTWALSIGLALMLCGSARSADNIWDLEAVDANGVGTDPRIGGDPGEPSSWVTVEGIAINTPSDMLASTMWQVYVQGEAPDAGGIAAWQGAWFNPSGWDWPPFPNVYAGDRIRIQGLIADHNGKVNINSRHSSDPGMQFTVTVLEPNVGMPTAILVPSLADANQFDQTRAVGGEHYQAQWCQLNDVWIAGGTWSPGETLTIEDDSGQTLDLFLSSEGDFNDLPAPQGLFSVRGIFDQEDETPPAHEAYRLWVMKSGDLRYQLSLNPGSGSRGEVAVQPAPDDPNLPECAPDDPNDLKYPAGTEVTLEAVAYENSQFLRWLIFDPNHPGDSNHAEVDTNNPITIVMDRGQEVKAVFGCGSSLGQLVPSILGMFGLAALTRRRR